MKKNRTKFFSVHCTGDVESMRRKIVAFTCLVTCLLLVVSCNKGQQAMENDSHTNAVGDCYYKSELNKDDFPSRVSLYQIDHWHSTDYNIEEALIKGTVVGHEVWAQGPQTIADYNGDQEYLTFYDAGEAFNGKKGNSIDGGFIYVDSSVKKWYEECSIPSPKWDQYNTIAHGASEEIKNSEQWESDDLDFCPLRDVEETLVEQFAAWDLNMRVLEEYTINVSPEKNCYLLMFMEMIDQIPVMPYFYTEGDVKYTKWLPNTTANVYVSEDGVIYMHLGRLIQPLQALEFVEIISLDEAKGDLENHVKTKYRSNVTVEDMGLYYIGMPGTQQDEYVLTPFWFFCVSVEKSTQKAEGNPETTTEYYYELLNATNGEWLYH